MKKHRFTVAALTFCCLTLIAIPAARATDGQIKIGRPADGESYPIVIDQAGSYVLTDNLVVGDPDLNAIEIVVNDVTLDLNGHTIHGPAATGAGSGISAENRYSITIQNGRVWGFGHYGMLLYSSSGDPSEKSAGHMIKNVQVLNNGHGIHINGGTIFNCVANSNLIDGITAHYSSIKNCTMDKNGYAAGLNLLNSTASTCSASGNSGYGVSAQDSIVENIAANENDSGGINANRSLISNCTASKNTGGPGIITNFSSVINCIASNNTGSGIVIYSGSRVEDNNCCENTAYGLYLFDVSTSIASYLYKNTGYNNTLGGIHNTANFNCHIPLPPVDNANRFYP